MGIEKKQSNIFFQGGNLIRLGQKDRTVEAFHHISPPLPSVIYSVLLFNYQLHFYLNI